MRWPPSLASHERWDGIEICRYRFGVPEGPLRNIALTAARNPVALVALLRELRRTRAELVHVQCVSGAAWFAYQAARILRLPLVVTLQGELTMDATDIYSRSRLLRHTLRLLLDRADVVTACSRATLSEAEIWAKTALGDRGLVVYNGVDNNEFATAGPVSCPNKPYILGIGRLVHQKGFDVLLEAFRLLVADPFFDWDLVIAGSGPEAATLQNQASHIGLRERVRFVGRTDRPTTVSLFHSAAVFVLPSRHEPFGIVNLEAMAAGAPLVASQVGGVPEIVEDGVNGLLVPPNNPTSLAAAIQRLRSSARLRTELAARGKEQAVRFDWKIIERGYRNVYARARARHVAAS
jgi:glycosyltransferase involved in cell wall biosynthesis